MRISDKLGSISFGSNEREQSMFNVGDKVVHPTRGAGVVINIENKDIIDKFDKYYVIDMVTSDMKLMVPVKNAKKIGLRQAIERSKVLRVLNILRGYPDELPEDHRERQARIGEKLKSGDAIAIAKVVRNLYWRDQEKKLTTGDTRLFDRGKQFLIGELALAAGLPNHHRLRIAAGRLWRPVALMNRNIPPPQ